MKSFDPGVIIELEKEGFNFFIMVELILGGGTLYYNNSDIDLWHGGHRYISTDFTFDQLETSGTMGVDQVVCRFNNADLSMGATVLSEDILSRTAILSFFCASAPGQLLAEDEIGIDLEGALGDLLLETPAPFGDQFIIAVEELFRGLISDWEIDEGEVKIEIKNELILWRKEALRSCQSSCPWEFEGTECGYSGSQTHCNQSYERCGELANTDNFGGHRFVLDVMEKEVWWGRNRDN